MSDIKNVGKQEAAVVVKDLYKSFKLPHEQSSGLKQALIGLVGGKKRKGYELQQVLDGISFEINKGEFFGIVGRNGSGKSTLLKLLSGIYTPDSGLVQVNGSLTPFIELGVGFNPELTGRENVFLNGALLGFSQKEMEAMYDDIVQFAELERFMDQKLKNYSSGMQVRLAFSIAIRADTDILILDEVLAVGDEAFQQKCNDYFERLKKEKKTIILVTHDMNSVERYCNRALLLEKGQIKTVGKPNDISRQYILDNMTTERSATDSQDKENNRLSDGVSELYIEGVTSEIRSSKEPLVFNVHYKTASKNPVYIGISILYQNVSVIEHNTQSIKVTNRKDVEEVFTYELPLDRFKSGRYKVTAAIFDDKSRKLLGFTDEASSFDFVIDNKDAQPGGLLVETGEWIKY